MRFHSFISNQENVKRICRFLIKETPRKTITRKDNFEQAEFAKAITILKNLWLKLRQYSLDFADRFNINCLYPNNKPLNDYSNNKDTMAFIQHYEQTCYAVRLIRMFSVRYDDKTILVPESNDYFTRTFAGKGSRKLRAQDLHSSSKHAGEDSGVGDTLQH